MADEYSAKIELAKKYIAEAKDRDDFLSAIRDVLRLLDASYVGLSRPEIERPEIERSKPPEVTGTEGHQAQAR